MSGTNGTVAAVTPVSLWRCLRGVGLAALGGVLAGKKRGQVSFLLSNSQSMRPDPFLSSRSTQDLNGDRKKRHLENLRHRRTEGKQVLETVLAASDVVGVGVLAKQAATASVKLLVKKEAKDALKSVAAKNLAKEAEEQCVNLASKKRTTHILHGDDLTGGHLWPGTPDHTPFPKDWSADKIMHHVSDVATDPKLKWMQQTGVAGSEFTKSGKPVRFVVIGEREGIRMKVILEPRGEGIITGFPQQSIVPSGHTF